MLLIPAFTMELVDIKSVIFGVGEVTVLLLIMTYVISSTYQDLFGFSIMPKADEMISVKAVEKLILALKAIPTPRRPAEKLRSVLEAKQKQEPNPLDDAHKKMAAR